VERNFTRSSGTGCGREPGCYHAPAFIHGTHAHLVLRVGLNATSLASPLTGIGNYVVHLGAALAASGEVELYSYFAGEWRAGSPVAPEESASSRLRQQVREAIKPWIPFKRELRQVREQALFRRGAHRHKIELYHEPNYVPLQTDVPTVTTIHDLSWVRLPGTHPADRVRWLERAMPGAVEAAGVILVDSQFTRSELVSIFAVDPSRVHVAWLGISRAFHSRSAAETASTLGARGLHHGGYVLNVGTLEPRKNVGHLLAAYSALSAALRRRYPLVIAGAKGWRASPLERQLRALAGDGQVRFLGPVRDDELAHLYAGAALFVFPSLYEGFGLPPLEAMASGVPVLVSDRASMPEVVGDAARLLDPERPERTTGQMEALLEDMDAREDLAGRGLRRAATFTWEACAKRTLDAYRHALQMRGS